MGSDRAALPASLQWGFVLASAACLVAFWAGWSVGAAGSVVGYESTGYPIRQLDPAPELNWARFALVCALVAAAIWMAPALARGTMVVVALSGAAGASMLGLGLPPFAPWLSFGPTHGGDFRGLALVIAVGGAVLLAFAASQAIGMVRTARRDAVIADVS